MKDLDIVVYGATGFTGKLCAEYIHASDRPVKWAIAGRSADKLKMVQGGLSPEIEIIIADGDDDVVGVADVRGLLFDADGIPRDSHSARLIVVPCS